MNNGEGVMDNDNERLLVNDRANPGGVMARAEGPI